MELSELLFLLDSSTQGAGREIGQQEWGLCGPQSRVKGYLSVFDLPEPSFLGCADYLGWGVVGIGSWGALV